MAIRIGIVGATGRMGVLCLRIIESTEEFELAAKLDSTSDLGELDKADVVVDFTTPSASPSIVEFSLNRGKNILVGTSGWTAERIEALEPTMIKFPDAGVAIVPNFSVGSVLATKFAAEAAPWFDDFEIIETHDSSKLDAPSGTAIRTAELISKERGVATSTGAESKVPARGAEIAGVPVHSIRLQGARARQQVIASTPGEVLRIEHEVYDLSAYEPGIKRSLLALPGLRGLVVGLDNLLSIAKSNQSRGRE
ncbi:MAG: 4-hydroxy-tetrahydrodipicolinate reductase [Cryobacterium sp.]|nr:4-hydroxy-tetrahydrodipicolinate reductase [Cryobacterium sp.]MCO5294158.1 4-hydroxy-tetrahydrodipicolinate reductase [Homoserinimonas sp.]